MNASFGYNDAEGGDFVLKGKIRYLNLDSDEWRLTVAGLNKFRSMLLQYEKPTEDVDELLLKIIDTPTKRIRVIKER